MVTKRQIKKLKDKLEPGAVQIDEVEIFLVNDDGTYQDMEGNNITEEEYQGRSGVEIEVK